MSTDIMTEIAELLNDEERELLWHKLASARRQHAIISGNCWELVDGLSEDWPYELRISNDQYGTPEWYAANAMTNAMLSVGATADHHDAARMDLVDMIGYFN